MQRVIIITPTWASNKDIFAPLNIKEEDVIEPSKTALATVVSRVEQEKKEHDEYLAKKRKYKEFQKAMSSATCIEAIPMSLMVEALDAGFFEGPPKWKHADDTHPTFCMLIIDDCLSLPMMMNPSSGLVNTCIKHRHIADGLGLSIAMLVQTYCAVGGLPRPIRENCTLLCLFKLKDQNQLKKIHEEIGSDVDLDRFDKYFEYATSKPYGFLAIDSIPKVQTRPSAAASTSTWRKEFSPLHKVKKASMRRGILSDEAIKRMYPEHFPLDFRTHRKAIKAKRLHTLLARLLAFIVFWLERLLANAPPGQARRTG